MILLNSQQFEVYSNIVDDNNVKIRTYKKSINGVKSKTEYIEENNNDMRVVKKVTTLYVSLSCDIDLNDSVLYQNRFHDVYNIIDHDSLLDYKEVQIAI